MLCHECHRTITIVWLLFALKNQSLFRSSFDFFDISFCCAGNRKSWVILFVGEFDFLLLENVWYSRYSYENSIVFSLIFISLWFYFALWLFPLCIAHMCKVSSCETSSKLKSFTVMNSPSKIGICLFVLFFSYGSFGMCTDECFVMKHKRYIYLS